MGTDYVICSRAKGCQTSRDHCRFVTYQKNQFINDLTWTCYRRIEWPLVTLVPYYLTLRDHVSRARRRHG